jgi:hypothetical protein
MHDAATFVIDRQRHPVSAEFLQHLKTKGEELLKGIEGEFGVRIILGSTSGPAANMTVYGPQDQVSNAIRQLEDAQLSFQAALQDEEQQALTSALRRQGVCMANDWRFSYADIPALSLRSDDTPYDALPRAENAAFQTRCGALLDKAMRNLQYLGTLRIHASFLLMRTLATSKDLAVVTETFGLVGSSILLAMKSHGVFSARKSKEVLQALYEAEHAVKVKSRQLQEYHVRVLTHTHAQKPSPHSD